MSNSELIIPLLLYKISKFGYKINNWSSIYFSSFERLLPNVLCVL